MRFCRPDVGKPSIGGLVDQVERGSTRSRPVIADDAKADWWGRMGEKWVANQTAFGEVADNGAGGRSGPGSRGPASAERRPLLRGVDAVEPVRAEAESTVERDLTMIGLAAERDRVVHRTVGGSRWAAATAIPSATSSTQSGTAVCVGPDRSMSSGVWVSPVFPGDDPDCASGGCRPSQREIFENG